MRLLTQSEQSIRRIVRNDALPVPLEVREVPLLEGELLVECRIAENARYVWLVARGDDGHSRIFQFYSILRGREWFRAPAVRCELSRLRLWESLLPSFV